MCFTCRRLDDLPSEGERHQPPGTAARTKHLSWCGAPSTEGEVGLAGHPPELDPAYPAPTGTRSGRCSSACRGGMTHIAHLMNKLGVRNRVEIAMWAYETGRMGDTS